MKRALLFDLDETLMVEELAVVPNGSVCCGPWVGDHPRLARGLIVGVQVAINAGAN